MSFDAVFVILMIVNHMVKKKKKLFVNCNSYGLYFNEISYLL